MLAIVLTVHCNCEYAVVTGQWSGEDDTMVISVIVLTMLIMRWSGGVQVLTMNCNCEYVAH